MCTFHVKKFFLVRLQFSAHCLLKKTYIVSTLIKYYTLVFEQYSQIIKKGIFFYGRLLVNIYREQSHFICPISLVWKSYQTNFFLFTFAFVMAGTQSNTQFYTVLKRHTDKLFPKCTLSTALRQFWSCMSQAHGPLNCPDFQAVPDFSSVDIKHTHVWCVNIYNRKVKKKFHYSSVHNCIVECNGISSGIVLLALTHT